MLLALLLATSNCVFYWHVTMPDGRELAFVGEVEDAFRAKDGYTEIWLEVRDPETGRMCCAPGSKWFFTDGFDSGGFDSWSNNY